VSPPENVTSRRRAAFLTALPRDAESLPEPRVEIEFECCQYPLYLFKIPAVKGCCQNDVKKLCLNPSRHRSGNGPLETSGRSSGAIFDIPRNLLPETTCRNRSPSAPLATRNFLRIPDFPRATPPGRPNEFPRRAERTGGRPVARRFGPNSISVGISRLGLALSTGRLRRFGQKKKGQPDSFPPRFSAVIGECGFGGKRGAS